MTRQRQWSYVQGAPVPITAIANDGIHVVGLCVSDIYQTYESSRYHCSVN